MGGRNDLVGSMGGIGLLHSLTRGRLRLIGVWSPVMHDELNAVVGNGITEMPNVLIVDGGGGYP